MAAATLLLLSCTQTRVEEPDRVQVPLSFQLQETGQPQTKTLDGMSQSGSAEGSFLGITDITFLPFSRQGAVQANDERLGYCDPLEAISAYNSNHTVLYENKWLPRDAASFLFYGKVNPGEVTGIWKTGSLRVNGLNGETPAGISFAPDPIAPATPDDTKRGKLVSYLNNIANASVNQVAGVASFANTYPAEYAQFTNYGQLMAGTSSGIKKRLEVLYKAINKKNDNPDLKTRILNLIRSSNVAWDNQLGITLPDNMAGYPGEDLPDGAYAMRWDGSKFVIGPDASLFMPEPGRYCYPIPLWYYANTPIRTTEDKANTYSALSSFYAGTATWDEVLAKYEKNPGKIRPETTGAVLVNPIQYGVAQLALTLPVTDADKLKDGDDADVRVNNDKFPVTGIIVGGQRIQDFNFQPVTGSDDYLVYDTQFTEKAYLSRTKASATLRCLVLETVPSAPVYLAVEFQNNSGNAFKGASGWVLPGTIFYLTGKLDLDDADSTGNGKIFERGCRTTVTVHISNLKGAYNVIPDLRDPQLQLGFTVRLDWDFNTPTNAALK